MSAVIVVFLIWFGVVAVAGFAAVLTAPRRQTPRWFERARTKYYASIDAAIPPAGRLLTAVGVLLALWSAVIIIGLIMGIIAHRLQGAIDEPAFRWWDSHHLHGTWYTVWWKLTDIGMPRLTQGLALAGAVVFTVLYRRRAYWWAPGVTMIVGYVAEKYSQQILKTVINRGHPPTAGGTYPSGGMGRVIDVYGLIIFFVVLYFWPRSRRAWAAGGWLLAVCASIQAYARLNNLEHWTTDVVAGGIYGVMLLTIMMTGYACMSRVVVARKSVERADSEPAVV